MVLQGNRPGSVIGHHPKSDEPHGTQRTLMGESMTIASLHRTALNIGNILGSIVSRKFASRPRDWVVARRDVHWTGSILEALEPRIALAASTTTGLYALADAAASQAPRPASLARIEKVAAAAYVWGLPAEFMYRFANYNELVTAPVNTFA